MVAPPFPLWAWLVFVGLVLALLFLTAITVVIVTVLWGPKTLAQYRYA
jgi:hypothetical protein